MAIPEKKFRIGQLKEDVEGLYEVVDHTRKTVADVRETQTDHGRRLSDVQWSTNLTMVRMNSIDCRMAKVEGAAEEHSQRLKQVDERLDRLAKGQREQAAGLGALDGKVQAMGGRFEARFEGLDSKFDGLDSKLDKVLALLTARPE